MVLNDRDPSNNDFTLGEINFKTRESFEAKEQEFQVGYASLIQFNHNDSIIRILKMCDPFRNEAGNNRRYMTV